MGSAQNDSAIKRRQYGEAANVVSNMLLEIKAENQDTALAHLINECCDVSNGQKKYIENCAFPESEMQQKILMDTQKDERTSTGLCMLSGHLEGNFLKLMAEMAQAKHILEIGMYTGYGAVTLAESAFCEEVVTLDVEPYYESFLKQRLAGSALEKKIRIIIGHAKESLEKLRDEGKQFDFIFIDANKGGYLNYYKFIMDNKLLKPTGTIACDNILWYGKTYNQGDSVGKTLHEFVEFVKHDKRVYQVIIPIRDGVLMIKPITQ